MSRKIFGLIFFLNALIFFFQAISKNVFAPLLPHFIEYFHINKAKAGFLVTLVFFGYALARFPSGLMSHRYGCTRTVLVGSVFLSLAFILMGLAPGYLSLAVFTFILGFASGIYVTAGYTLSVIIGTKKRAATATALYEMFGMIAGIISPLIVTYFVLNLSWRSLFMSSGAVLLLVTVLFFVKRSAAVEIEKGQDFFEKEEVNSDDEGESVNGSTERKEGLLEIFMRIFKDLLEASRPLVLDPSLRRFLIWSTLVGGFGALSFTGVTSFLPTLLVNEKGYSYEAANQMFVLVSVSGLCTKMVIGWLGDKFGILRVFLGNLTIEALIIFGLAAANSHVLLLVLVLMWGATALNSNTLINSYVLQRMPDSYQAAGFGLFSTAYTVIYSLGPYFTGSLSGFFSLNSAVAMSALGIFIAIIFIVYKFIRFGEN